MPASLLEFVLFFCGILLRARVLQSRAHTRILYLTTNIVKDAYA